MARLAAVLSKTCCGPSCTVEDREEIAVDRVTTEASGSLKTKAETIESAIRQITCLKRCLRETAPRGIGIADFEEAELRETMAL
jgi:hypothetical protein